MHSGSHTRDYSRTYIWDPRSSSEVRNPKIIPEDEVSLITLSMEGRTLLIHQVMKGRGWPSKEDSFCSLMLPAVIRNFLNHHHLRLQDDVDNILVWNFANPPIAGCKCYTRTMISFGYDIINGLKYQNGDDFCRSDQDTYIIRARSSGTPMSGESSQKQLEYLDDAITSD
jgi:hypothetical protein